MQLPDLEPGAWADWANAIATTLAFTVALVLFLIGLRDRRRADEDRRREQARHVWIWPTGMSGGTLVRPGEVRYEAVDFTIENNSEEPISGCIVTIAPPWTEVTVRSNTSIDLIRPSTKESRKLPYGEVHPEAAPPPPLRLFFQDSAGIVWRRGSDATLVEMRRSRRWQKKQSA